MSKKLLLFGLVFAFFWGCTKLDPKIAAPAYLQIDDYTVITDSNLQGTNNQKFTDVMVASSTTNYGYYPIPGKIPIPITGSTYLSIRPVVKINGVGALRLDYPFLKGSDTTLSLTAGQVTKFKPVFKYYSNLHFRFLESFNVGSSYIVNSNLADTFCVKPSYLYTPSFDGRCLYMQLDAAHTVCQAQSQNTFYLPTDGTNVYIEINYKCNTAFEVGIIGSTSQNGPLTDQRSAGGANASASWNKLYISLSDLLRTQPTYLNYYLYFYTTYDTSNPLNQIYIDNIKVISQI